MQREMATLGSTVPEHPPEDAMPSKLPQDRAKRRTSFGNGLTREQ
jgi:hypothetical protein